MVKRTATGTSALRVFPQRRKGAKVHSDARTQHARKLRGLSPSLFIRRGAKSAEVSERSDSALFAPLRLLWLFRLVAAWPPYALHASAVTWVVPLGCGSATACYSCRRMSLPSREC